MRGNLSFNLSQNVDSNRVIGNNSKTHSYNQLIAYDYKFTIYQY